MRIYFSSVAKVVITSGLVFTLNTSVLADELAVADAVKGAGSNPHAMMPQVAEMLKNPHGGETFAVGSRASIDWKVPKGWEELPATRMRLGNFIFTHTNGQKVEITVSSLPAPAGGLPANINMWRSQINLPSVEDAEAQKNVKKEKFADSEMEVVNLVSSEKLIDGKMNASVVAAVLTHGDLAGGQSVWFFKMKGEEEAVKAADGSFREFLASLKFLDSK